MQADTLRCASYYRCTCAWVMHTCSGEGFALLCIHCYSSLIARPSMFSTSNLWMKTPVGPSPHHKSLYINCVWLISNGIIILNRSVADEEVKAMKLQREMRDKANRLQALQAKYSTLEQVCESWPLNNVQCTIVVVDSFAILLEPWCC